MTEVERLRDRVEQLEQVLGADRSLSNRLRGAFGIEPGLAPILGMLLQRTFVTHDSLYTVLYADRPECDWPEAKTMDVQICKLRRKLKARGIQIQTRWGEGWCMSAADKAKARAVLDEAENPAAAVIAAQAMEAGLAARRHAFLNGS